MDVSAKLADLKLGLNVLSSAFLAALAVGTAGCTTWKDRDGSVPLRESDSDRIEAAIAVACAQGSRLVTLGRNERREDGRWMIDRAILLPDDFWLKLDGAWIELLPGTKDNIIRNAGAASTGTVAPNRNIRILGRNGAVLCGGRGNYFSPCRSGDSNGWRAMGILFAGVTNYEIAGFTMKETQCWAISQEGCAHGHVHDIEFDSTDINRNQDGIDVRKGCHDIVIENIRGVTGDDTIALTGLRRQVIFPRDGKEYRRPCEISGWWPTDNDDIHDIVVRNVRARSEGGHGVVRLLAQDGIKMYNIVVSNIVDTTTGEQRRAHGTIRVGDVNYWSLRRAQPGDMHHITIADIDAKGQTGILVKGYVSDSTFTGIRVPEGTEKFEVAVPLQRTLLEGTGDARPLEAGNAGKGSVTNDVGLQARSADKNEDLEAAVAADEIVPVRPGGVEGRPFWNGHSARFIYAPAFDFPLVAGAQKYRFTVVDDDLKEHVFEADRPTAALSPVWRSLPVGYVRVHVTGLDAKGRVVGESGSRRFWRDASYAPGTYKGKPWSYMECVKRYYPVLFEHGNTQHFLKHGTPDGITDLLNIYPSKMNAALVNAMLRYATLEPKHAEDALKVAKAAADYVISISQPAGAPLEFFPPTYWKMEGQTSNFASIENRGQNMLVYPAGMGSAYISLYNACGEKRFLDAALGIARTYRRLQLPEGTWYLKMWEHDGSPFIGGNGKRPVRLVPMQVCAFMERLADATGDASWREVAARAFAYIENGPLKTWDWAAQFEDTKPSAGYRNHSSVEAMLVAGYIMKRHSGDAAKMQIARELVRWVEDQFVFWRKPGRADGQCPIVGNDNEFGPWAPNPPMLDFAEWPEEVPGVTEKYRWTMMESSLAAMMAGLYVDLYRIDGNRLALAKARTLCDSIVRIQKMGGDGEIASEWRKKFIVGSRCPHVWMNCSVATVMRLEGIAAVLEEQ